MKEIGGAVNVPASEPIRAWHFLLDSGTLALTHYGASLAPQVGDVLHVTTPLEMCKRGLHASRSLLAALAHAHGSLVCRVSCWGEVIEEYDKLVAEYRRIDWMVDATMTLHEFACRQAEQALEAIRVKRAWMNGKATDSELDAGWSAAWVARDAAWVAAWSAARAAARAAAWSAARAAARVARDAAWDAANQQLEEMVEALRT